jgi:hypothetical protein
MEVEQAHARCLDLAREVHRVIATSWLLLA